MSPFLSRRPLQFDGRPQPVLTRPRSPPRRPAAAIPRPGRASRGPRDVIPRREGVTRRPRGVISRRERITRRPRGVISRREGITRRPRAIMTRRRVVISRREGVTTRPRAIMRRPRGVISLPEAIISATISTESGTLWTTRGEETTSPSPPRRTSARRRTPCFTLWTQSGRVSTQRRRVWTERRRGVTLRGRLWTQIRRVERSTVPRVLARVPVMTSPGRRVTPRRRLTTRSGTGATQIERPPFRREQPRSENPIPRELMPRRPKSQLRRGSTERRHRGDVARDRSSDVEVPAARQPLPPWGCGVNPSPTSS
jgi:hypothetical protein